MASKVLLALCTVLLLVQIVFSSPFEEEENDGTDMAYFDSPDQSLMESVQKRSCIRRGGGCYHRRNDCCFNSACRCNLWGSNCRCHRAGLFQKWG